jgi:hypothetical protein
MMKEQLRWTFLTIPNMVQAKVSLDRLDSFLKEVGLLSPRFTSLTFPRANFSTNLNHQEVISLVISSTSETEVIMMIELDSPMHHLSGTTRRSWALQHLLEETSDW